MDTVIKVTNFSWAYKASKERLILDSINLKVAEGEFIGIMGPTGAGKSTLCTCMNGLIPLRTRGWIKGTVEVFGKNTRDLKMSDLGVKIGLVFQDPETQFIMMSVEDEIVLGLENLGLTREEIRARVAWALNLVDLEGFEHRAPDELSGGQKQKVAIAAIMAMRPKILILDEPTSDLDPHGTLEFFELLKKIKEEFKLTIILISHETKKVLDFCDRVILLNDGKIKFDGTKSEFLKQSLLIKKLGIYIPPEIAKKYPELDYSVTLSNPIKSSYEGREIAVEVKNLSYTYPDLTEAIKNLSLKIYKGEFIAIIGKNGSGKTTLVKHFNGLLKSQTGKSYLYGKSIKNYTIPEIAKTIGFCYQDPDHQLFKNTVREEIEFGLKNLKMEESKIDRRYNEIVDLLGLRKFEEMYESTFYLSKGIRQRLALASVLVLKPEILIVDEPTTGQSYELIQSFMKILQKLHADGRTIIIITHNPYIIAHYAESVVILDDGKLVEKLPTMEFLKDEALQKIAAFIPP
ncbi:MAG: ATP-binding cassette domain-containing protein [Candidatus Lokiarchaeota archaeon]|nr:ATP-binding cassette domain-containing protein [Candidatus Lokiarchaeota archaeon]MBD3343344.1 ATP-binding cassette domain-containing protein [Candidatus Lokiarchaeota archaeon]